MRSHFKNSCFVFYGDSQTLKNNISPWPNVLRLSSVFSCLELNLGKTIAPALSESKVLILSCCQDDIYNPRLNFDHLIRDCTSHLQTINFLVKHLLYVSCFGVPPLGMQWWLLLHCNQWLHIAFLVLLSFVLQSKLLLLK